MVNRYFSNGGVSIRGNELLNREQIIGQQTIQLAE